MKDLHQYRTAEANLVKQGLENEDNEADADEELKDISNDEMDDLEDNELDVTFPMENGLSLPNNDHEDNHLTGNPFDHLGNEKELFSARCEVILPSTNSVHGPSRGKVIITKSKIFFIKERLSASDAAVFDSLALLMPKAKKVDAESCDSLWACQPFPSTVWQTDDICNVLQRYYQLRFVAVEIFTTSREAFFFNLFDQKTAMRFQFVLRTKVKPPYMAPFLGRRPITIMARSTISPNSTQSLTAAWANREISNFEYLMRLNTIAGRTYNDLGQYPIFPWIIADYSNEVLDLRDENTFRDLRWPIGAQDPQQRQQIISKYNDLMNVYDPDDELSLPPFHYGTHYSVSGFVLWYLMRLEPYTSLHVQLQDGRIDRADRLLDSLGAAWKGCTSNPSDVKELIPEMFYNPDIFKNINNVDFGRTQANRKIGDIILPPWAKDPHDFIRKHRDALESEYVSRNLHHWIDLVFGYKQRPPHLVGGSEAAVDACNVFFHLTYENAVDLDKLRDSNPQLYIQYMCQINEFGQSPCQLFTKEHIQRLPLSKVDFIWPIASIVRGVHTIYDPKESIGMPRRILCFKEIKVSESPILVLFEEEERLITVDGGRILGLHAWQVHSADAVPPFKLKPDMLAYEMSKG